MLHLIRLIVAVFISFQFGNFHWGWAQSLDLDRRWKEEIRDPLSSFGELQEKILKASQNVHFVFVAGFLNGLAKGPGVSYMGENIRAVTDRDSFHSTASYLGPRSKVSIAGNEKFILGELLNIHEQVGAPLVVFLHSKAVPEVMNVVFRHPELMLGDAPVIARVISVQGALGGSSLAAGNYFGLRPINFLFGPGFRSLAPDPLRQALMEAYSVFKERLATLYGHLGSEIVDQQRASISKRIFYVSSFEEAKDMSWGVWAVLGVCGGNLHALGLNDGLLLVKNQVFTPPEGEPEFGVSLNPIRADHTALTLRAPFSSLFPYQMRAFTRAVIGLALEE